MRFLRYFSIVIFCLVFIGCKKAPYQTYSGTTYIQFGPAKASLYSPASAFQDSLKEQTFAYLDNSKTVDTVFFDIYTMGDVSNQDRPFKLVQEQVVGAENAVAGVHFKDLNEPDVAKQFVIRAGEMHSRVPITLLRDPSLREKSVTLRISVVENEYFRKGQENLTWRRLVFTDKLSRPNTWNVGMLGKYSEVKHRFMISVTGEKWDSELISYLARDVQAQHYWLGKIKTALLQYNTEHPTVPLTDEDNELIVFP